MIMMDSFQIILEQAAFAGKKVSITTKERGVISGFFTGADEYDTDDDRFGFFIDTSEHECDTVYVDEIVEIVTSPIAQSKGYVQLTAKLVSGE